MLLLKPQVLALLGFLYPVNDNVQSCCMRTCSNFGTALTGVLLLLAARVLIVQRVGSNMLVPYRQSVGHVIMLMWPHCTYVF